MLPLALSVLLSAVAASAAPPLLPYPRSTRAAGEGDDVVFIVSNANLSRTEQVTVSTLSGVLARDSPRLYRLNTPEGDPTDTTHLWLNVLRNTTTIEFDDTTLLPSTLAGSIETLLAHFSRNISGFVLYDPTTNSTNAALITCAAAPGNVIAVGDHPTQSFLLSLGIPLVADVSASSPIDAFRAHKGGLSRRMAIFQPDDGSKSPCLSAFAMLGRIATIEHSAKAVVAYDEGVANYDATTLNAAFGWTSWDEHWIVSTLTKHGAMIHASDYASNLDILSNIAPTALRPALAARRRERSVARAAARARVKAEYARDARRGEGAAAQAQHTVAFVMSDGDNIQLLQNVGFMGATHYGSPLRGAVPVGWSYSPAMAALMPTLLGHVHDTLTANDSISAGPSGAGYACVMRDCPSRLCVPQSFDLAAYGVYSRRYFEVAATTAAPAPQALLRKHCCALTRSVALCAAARCSATRSSFRRTAFKRRRSAPRRPSLWRRARRPCATSSA